MAAEGVVLDADCVYNKIDASDHNLYMMDLVFDPAKDKSNLAKHGISLARAGEMEMKAVIEEDRLDYGEERYRAFGLIDDVAYRLAFTVRESHVRAISLRRAQEKEIKRYVR